MITLKNKDLILTLERNWSITIRDDNDIAQRWLEQQNDDNIQHSVQALSDRFGYSTVFTYRDWLVDFSSLIVYGDFSQEIRIKIGEWCSKRFTKNSMLLSDRGQSQINLFLRVLDNG